MRHAASGNVDGYARGSDSFRRCLCCSCFSSFYPKPLSLGPSGIFLSCFVTPRGAGAVYVGFAAHRPDSDLGADSQFFNLSDADPVEAQRDRRAGRGATNASTDPNLKAAAMPKSNISYERISDFLPSDERQALFSWCLLNSREFENAGVLRESEGVAQHDRNIRVASHALLRPDLRRMISRRIDQKIPQLMSGLGVRAQKWKKEINVAAHNDGAHFSRHIDLAIGKNDAHSRRISAIYYFHAEVKKFEGGQLRLHSLLGGEFIDIEPEQNTLIAFPSFLPHEVVKVSCPGCAFADSRFAVNIWLHQD